MSGYFHAIFVPVDTIFLCRLSHCCYICIASSSSSSYTSV